MKQQFVRIQPSSVSNEPQQTSTSEEQLSGQEQDRWASSGGLTPPPAQNNIEKSPAAYWARKDSLAGETLLGAPQYSQAGAKEVLPEVFEQATERQPAQASSTGNLMHPQAYRVPTGELSPRIAGSTAWPYSPATNTAPTQNSPVTQGQGMYAFVPPPAPMSPSYAPPSHPGVPYGQRPVTGPMLPNNSTGGYPPPYGQRPITGPMPPNNANYGPPMQPPPFKPEKAFRKKKRFPIWARVVVALVSVLLVGGGTAFGYYQANFANPLGKITGQQAAQIGKDGQSANSVEAVGNGIGSKRINILLLGSDNDGKNAAPLAQTDIVITIDPQTNYVGMLSIPRDLRVVIPDEGTGKMDAAFSFGWQGNFGGATPLSNAAGLSIATVEKNFGIHIDHYAWVGLDGFVKVINTANGVDIDATHPIADNSYPNDVNNANHFDYKRLYIAPGPQHMNGIQALEYVRTRHADLVGDFGRSARQQQVLSQLKTKLDTPSIITKLPELANDLGDTVKTDMSIQDIINFMGYARNIDPAKMDRLILSPPYSAPATDKTGDFLPNCSMITPKIAQMFALGNNANCISTASVNPGNAPVLAANQSGPHVAANIAPVAATLTNSMSTITQFLNSLNTIQRNNVNVTGVHNLLDLMFLVVFESFDAIKI